MHRLFTTLFVLGLYLYSSALACASGNILAALSALQSGSEPFSFYDLGLSADEKTTLEQIPRDEFSNNLLEAFFPSLKEDNGDKFFWDACNTWDIRQESKLLSKQRSSMTSKLSSKLTSELEDVFAGKIESNLLHAFSTIIFTKVCDILSWGQFPGAEVVLRISPAYSDNPPFHCSMWHVDKNYKQLRGSTENTDTIAGKEPLEAHHEKFEDLSLIFLLPLLGEGGLFHNLSLEHKAMFEELAKESSYFYNIRDSNLCPAHILNSNFVAAEEGMASAHKIGRAGCVHSAPFASKQGRIILIVTPIISQQKVSST